MTQELVAGLCQTFLVVHRLELQEAMEGRDDATRAEVGPDASPGTVIGIIGQQVWRVVRICLTMNISRSTNWFAYVLDEPLPETRK